MQSPGPDLGPTSGRAGRSGNSSGCPAGLQECQQQGWEARGHGPAPHRAAPRGQGASRSCQKACFLSQSEVAMVIKAGGDTRWSGPAQIIFPGSSLCGGTDLSWCWECLGWGNDILQRPDPWHQFCVHGGVDCVGHCVHVSMCVRVCYCCMCALGV